MAVDVQTDIEHILRDSARDDAPRILARPSEPTADAFHADSAVAARILDLP